MLHNTAASSEGFHCKKNWVGPKCVLIIWREQIPYSTVILWRLNTMSKTSEIGVFLWVNAWEHHLPAIWPNYLLVVLHYFPFVISNWPLYDNFCTIRTEQQHYYRTVREYGFDSTSCSNHMQLFYTLTTTRARQRLSGSTLLFGFGFFKSPFPAGIMWIFVSWIPAEVRGWSWLLIGSLWCMTYWRMFCVCDCYDCQTLHFREKCIKTSLVSHECTYSWLFLRA